MRIKSFQLGSHKIKVKYVKSLIDFSTDSEIFGRANAKTNILEVATHIGGEPLAEDVITHSLYHELAHFMMILMNQWDLNLNEAFIDSLGGFIAQFDKTKK
jgi:hypothetical protein